MSPILGIYASQISGHLSTNNFSSIATQTVGSGGASSITFSSIPSTYTHLQIRGIYRSNRASTADNVGIQFNGDTATNYSSHELYANGTSALVSSDVSVAQIYAARASAASIGANIFGGGVIDILDYANTNKYKTTRSLSGFDDNSTNGQVWFESGNWRNTAAINSITLFATNGNLTQYSSFALYGIL